MQFVLTGTRNFCREKKIKTMVFTRTILCEISYCMMQWNYLHRAEINTADEWVWCDWIFTNYSGTQDECHIRQKVKTGNIAHCAFFSRKKGLFTRDKCKLYLKQHCDSSGDGVWRVKVRRS